MKWHVWRHSYQLLVQIVREHIFEHQGYLKVAWEKQDNHEVDMEKEKDTVYMRHRLKMNLIFSRLDDHA